MKPLEYKTYTEIGPDGKTYKYLVISGDTDRVQAVRDQMEDMPNALRAACSITKDGQTEITFISVEKESHK